jgi:hypothetical protein
VDKFLDFKPCWPEKTAKFAGEGAYLGAETVTKAGRSTRSAIK